jgi:ATP-binding cassette subfamily F protein uup
LPGLIEELDARQAELEAERSADGFYKQNHAVTEVLIDALASTRSELAAAYSRWEELERKIQGD